MQKQMQEKNCFRWKPGKIFWIKSSYKMMEKLNHYQRITREYDIQDKGNHSYSVSILSYAEHMQIPQLRRKKYTPRTSCSQPWRLIVHWTVQTSPASCSMRVAIRWSPARAPFSPACTESSGAFYAQVVVGRPGWDKVPLIVVELSQDVSVPSPVSQLRQILIFVNELFERGFRHLVREEICGSVTCIFGAICKTEEDRVVFSESRVSLGKECDWSFSPTDGERYEDRYLEKTFLKNDVTINKESWDRKKETSSNDTYGLEEKPGAFILLWKAIKWQKKDRRQNYNASLRRSE